MEAPLVGGPQILGEREDCDCSSRVRLGKSREACSWRGEPAPTLALDSPARPDEDLATPKGDFVVGIPLGSVIEVNPDRFMFSCPSGLVVGAIVDLAEESNLICVVNRGNWQPVGGNEFVPS